MQIPAAFAHTHDGDDAGFDVRHRGQRRQHVGGMGGRAEANDERQVAEIGDILVGDHFSVAVDELEFPLILPDCIGTALGDVDIDGVRQAALDGDMLHPGQRFDPLAGVFDGKAENGITLVHTQCGLQQGFGGIGLAVKFDGGNPQIDSPAETLFQVADHAAAAGGMGHHGTDQDHDETDHAKQDESQIAALPAHQQFQPAGPHNVRAHMGEGAAFQTRHVAFSTIQTHRAGKFMPQKAACSGNKDVGVRPGCVFTSRRINRPGSPLVSS